MDLIVHFENDKSKFKVKKIRKLHIQHEDTKQHFD